MRCDVNFYNYVILSYICKHTRKLELLLYYIEFFEWWMNIIRGKKRRCAISSIYTAHSLISSLFIISSQFIHSSTFINPYIYVPKARLHHWSSSAWCLSSRILYICSSTRVRERRRILALRFRIWRDFHRLYSQDNIAVVEKVPWIAQFNRYYYFFFIFLPVICPLLVGASKNLFITIFHSSHTQRDFQTRAFPFAILFYIASSCFFFFSSHIL